MAHVEGAHSFFWGADVTRFQLNGVETNNQRGYFQFTGQLGRAAIENLRMGTPSIYEITLGDSFIEPTGTGPERCISATNGGCVGCRFTLVSGIAGNRAGRGAGRDTMPFDCDCNNWSPRLGITAEYRTAGCCARPRYLLRQSRPSRMRKIVIIRHRCLIFSAIIRSSWIRSRDLIPAAAGILLRASLPTSPRHMHTNTI